MKFKIGFLIDLNEKDFNRENEEMGYSSAKEFLEDALHGAIGACLSKEEIGCDEFKLIVREVR